MKKFYFIALLAISQFCIAQTQTPGITVGLLYSVDELVADGYTLYSPFSGDKAYLIDNCGLVVNEWNWDGGSNYTGCHLLPDGSVIKLVLAGGGVAAYGDACFERRSWDDELIWSYCGEGRFAGIHSDLVLLPNGNFAALVQDAHTPAESIAAGVNPNNLSNSWSTESVVEFMPTGLTTGEVVWEWREWDHLIQDFDPTKDNYGVVSENIGKIDCNNVFGNEHFNSLFYIEERDQFLMSSWRGDEIYIIDHNISNEDAMGPAGDLLWRWGNPSNYDMSGSQMLFGQHNPEYINAEYEHHGGKISVFNNGYAGAPGSGACVINPIYDELTNTYMVGSNGAFLPEDFDWAWGGEIFPGSNMSSGIMGGVSPQSNGNLTICEATKGRFSEVTFDGDIVWVYQNPDNGNVTPQGQTSNADVYKVEKYHPTYAAFDGRDMTPGTTVEDVNELSVICSGSVESELNAFVTGLTNSGAFPCGNEISPVMNVYNFGMLEITEMEIEYSINGEPAETFVWTGNIISTENTSVELPTITYAPEPNNEITITIITVNGAMDEVPNNNTTSSTWESAIASEPGEYLMIIETDQWGYETNWNIQNGNGDIVFSGNGYDSNSTYEIDLLLNEPGCYTLNIIDTYGDGIIGDNGISLIDPDGNEFYVTPNGDWSSQQLIFAIVLPVPLAQPSFTYEVDGQTVYFNNTTIGEEISSFSWDLDNGFIYTEDSLNSYTFAPGDYEVCLTATNPAGDVEHCETFTIEEPVGFEDYLVNVASINILPNPIVNQQFELLIESTETSNIITSIYSIDGQLVSEAKNLQLQIGANRFQFDLPKLSSGQYVLKISDADKSMTRKLMIVD